MTAVYLSADGRVAATSKQNLEALPFFDDLLESGKGSRDDPIKMDMSYDVLRLVLNYARNYETSLHPQWADRIIQQLSKPCPYTQNDFIDIDVGGVVYCTTQATLEKIPYFAAFLRFGKELPAFIDRDGPRFAEVLCLARHESYTAEWDAATLHEFEFFAMQDETNKAPFGFKMPTTTATGALATIISVANALQEQCAESFEHPEFKLASTPVLCTEKWERPSDDAHISITRLSDACMPIAILLDKATDIEDIDVVNLMIRENVVDSITSNYIKLWMSRNAQNRAFYKESRKLHCLIPLCFSPMRTNRFLLLARAAFASVIITIKLKNGQMYCGPTELFTRELFMNNQDRTAYLQTDFSIPWVQCKTASAVGNNVTLNIPQGTRLCIITITSSNYDVFQKAHINARGILMGKLYKMQSLAYAAQNEYDLHTLHEQTSDGCHVNHYFFPIDTTLCETLEVKLTESAEVQVTFECSKTMVYKDDFAHLE